MTEINIDKLILTFQRILSMPTPDDLWQLQADLLAIGGEAARQARAVAGEFYKYLRTLESKSASRQASRVGAALATGAVSSIGIQEMLTQQADPLRGLLSSMVTTVLEVGSAFKIAEAWEVEAALMYSDLAWYLYGELWDISLTSRPELETLKRQETLNLLLKPVLDQKVPDNTKAILIVRLFQALLTAHIMHLLPGVGSSINSE